MFPNTERYKDRLPQQIRGAAALKKYLALVAPGEPLPRAAREWLSPAQQCQLAYEVPCARCGAVPEGLVRVGSTREVQFRCPRGICHAGRSFARCVDIEVRLLNNLSSRFGPGTEISSIAQRALRAWAGEAGHGEPPAGQTIQRPIRLTATQYYMYEFETLPGLSAILNVCLRKLWENSSARN